MTIFNFKTMIVFLFAFTCFWVDVSFAQVAPITMSAHDIEIRTNSEECVKHIQNSLHSGISVNTLIESEDRYGIINGKLLFIDLTSLPFPTNSIEEASQRIKQFNGVIDVVTGIRTFRWDEQTRKALENFLAALKSCEVRDMRDYEKQMITNGVNSTMSADMQIARIRENIAELPKYRQLQGDIKKTIRNDVLSQIKPMADKETPAKSNTPESHRARGEAFYRQMLRQVASELQKLIRKFDGFPVREEEGQEVARLCGTARE